MHPTLTPGKTASAIWSRIVQPQRGTLSPDVARALLKLSFDSEDQERVDLLSSRESAGIPSDEERAELEEYVRVNNELMILQSKARLSLQEPRLEAKR